MTKLIDQIDGPADLKGLEDDQLQQVAQEVRELIIDTIGEIGGHFGANLGACEIAVALHSLLDSPTDKVLWDVGHQAYPHKVLTGRRDQLHTIRKYERARAVLLDAGVRARHHGRRSRLDLGLLRGRHQGGDAPRHRSERPRGRSDRRRRPHRRRVLRGAAQRRRHGHADRDRRERQRHVDRPERRLAVALLQPHAPQPEAVPRARGRGGDAHPSAGRDRQAHRAARADPEGVAEGLLGAGPVLRGARPRVRRRDRRPRREGAAPRDRRGAGGRPAGRRALQDGQGQGLRAGRGGRPRGHGEVARRQARVDLERGGGRGAARRSASPSSPARRSTRPCSARRSWRSAAATSASSASRPR